MTLKSLTSLEMLDRLIAFQTVSSDSNLALIDFVRSYLSEFGLEPALVYDAEKNKANLFVTLGPNIAGGVVLSGHTDVVPAKETAWMSDPWQLCERDGKLFGRGTTDMKGFVALALAAIPKMLASGLKVPVHIALSYDEEVGCKGAPSLVKKMAATIPAPSSVIVGEPTMLELVNGHKGSLSFFTKVTGHSVHSSRIDTGVSAVMVASRLVTWMDDRMNVNRDKTDPSNPFMPPYTTLHCGQISGGVAANVVAGECSFVTDIRPIPSDDPWRIKQDYIDYIHNEIEPRMKAIAPSAGVEIIERGYVPSLSPEKDSAAEALFIALTGNKRSSVVSYGTEAGIFQRAGWSTIVAGPGDIAQAHQANEFLSLEQFNAGEKFIHRLIDRLSA